MHTGAPLSGASVVLHLNTVDDLAATSPTDAQGHFFFDNLPPGIYTLQASHPGFDARWFEACTAKDQGVALQLGPSEARTDVKVPLPNGESDGRNPTRMKYQAEYYPGTSSRTEAILIHISMREVRDNVDFHLSVVHSAEVEAIVQPLAGLQEQVSFQANLSSAFDEAFIGFGFETSGSTQTPLQIQDVFPGKYHLRISAVMNGRTFGGYDLVDITNEESVHKVTVQLQPSVEIHGVVKIEGPLAIDLKSLRISLEANREAANAAFQANGTFAISHVPPGRYSIDIRPIPRAPTSNRFLMEERTLPTVASS